MRAVTDGAAQDRRRTPYALWSCPARHSCCRCVARVSLFHRRANNDSTDAAIAELRQLMAEQRAALDRQARVIEEQGRTLAALQRQVEGPKPSTETQPWLRRRLEHQRGRKPHRCRAHTGFARRGCDGGRFPGFDSHSRDRIGHQAGRSGTNGRGSHADALGTEDRFITLRSRWRSTSGRGSAHGLLPTASRLSTELRMPSEEVRCACSSKAISPESGAR